ncbi:MAG TPA: antibiotic biosynthesis monooxygenase [Parvularcula sp.]|nr:antibiotic biosynthesis monooxygenase [Parvularcula sp.]
MIIVSGHAKLKPGALARARGAMLTAIEATRREEGCLFYSYREDVTAPDTIIILEYWKDWASLERHFTEPHMVEWVKALGEVGVVSRDIRAAEAGVTRTL